MQNVKREEEEIKEYFLNENAKTEIGLNESC